MGYAACILMLSMTEFGRCGMGAVKVAVHNDEDRLHRMDVKEGKDLPYLYRNPAV